MNVSMKEENNRFFDKKFLFWFGIVFFCLFIQFIPVVNYLATVAVFSFSLIGLYKGWPSALLPIISLSFLHGDSSVSLYTLKLSGISLFYILILILFFIKLIHRKTISKFELFFIFLFFSYFIYSVLIGNFSEESYFKNDSLLFIISVVFLFIIYDVKRFDIDKLLMALSLSYFLVKVIVCLTGIGLETIPYSFDVDQKIAIFDPIENFLLVYNLQSFIFPRSRTIRIIALFNTLTFCFASYLLGYVHGATMVLTFITFLYCILRRKRYIAASLIVICFLIPLSISFTSLVEGKEQSVLLYKIQKVIGLFEFFYSSDLGIYDLPRSTQVRMIESANLFNQNPLFLFFGNGFGGYITENTFHYGSYLNEDDYTIDQISSGKYQVLHGYNQIILKHGIISIILGLFVFLAYRKREYRNFRDSAILFIFLSYSFTVKPYLIIAMLVMTLKKGEDNVKG